MRRAGTANYYGFRGGESNGEKPGIVRGGQKPQGRSYTGFKKRTPGLRLLSLGSGLLPSAEETEDHVIRILADLSNNNGAVAVSRLASVRAIDGFWHKASEGLHFHDADYQHRVIAARAHGLAVGAYHFARPDRGSSPRDEAENFLAAVAGHGFDHGRDLRPVLDLEAGNPHPAYVKWAREWNRIVQARLGVLPLFYSFPSYVDGLEADRPIGAGLWIASYGRDDGREHPFRIPHPWRHASVHQFTSKARIEGVTGFVDLSRVMQPAAILSDSWTCRG